MLSLFRVSLIALSLSFAMPLPGVAAIALRAPLFEQKLQIPNPTLKTQLQFEGHQYLTAQKESADLNETQLASIRLRYEEPELARGGKGAIAWLRTGADLGAMSYLSPNESHILVQELYVTPRTQAFTGNFSATLGRKKIPWSGIDRSWSLGLWQPYFEIDALRLEQQGLTGAFFDFDQTNFQLVGFATPVFIPNLGPTIREENGQIITKNRWSQTYPREVRFGGDLTPIDYELMMPETADVVQHAGYSLMARVGQTDQGFWGTSSVGFKPMNEFALVRSVRVPIETNHIRIQVRPEVMYHTIVAVDAGYSGESAGVTLSYLQDDPQEQSAPEGWSIQKFEGLKIYSAGVYWQVPAFKTRSVGLKLDYLRAFGGDIEDVGSDGNRDLLSQDKTRLKFNDAVRVQAQAELFRLFRRPLLAEVAWLYDQEQKGALIHTEFQFFPTEQWAVLAGADILGADDNAASEIGFLTQYRANDRVYGGMAYAF